MEFGQRIRSEVQRIKIYQDFMKIGVPSGFHGKPVDGLEEMEKEKEQWMDPQKKGFVTGLRQRFFKNGEYAWEAPKEGCKDG